MSNKEMAKQVLDAMFDALEKAERVDLESLPANGSLSRETKLNLEMLAWLRDECLRGVLEMNEDELESDYSEELLLAHVTVHWATLMAQADRVLNNPELPVDQMVWGRLFRYAGKVLEWRRELIPEIVAAIGPRPQAAAPSC